MQVSYAQTMTENSVGGGKTALIVTSSPTVIVAASRSANGRLFVTAWPNGSVENLVRYEDCAQFKGGVLSEDTEFEIDVIGDRLIVRQSDEE